MMPTPRRRALSDLAGAAGYLLVQVRPIASAIGQEQMDADVEITGLAYDSSKVAPGDLFFCVPGTRADGHDFAGAAAAAGAAALCVERDVDVSLPAIVVSDARRALGRIAAAFYGNPADEL